MRKKEITCQDPDIFKKLSTLRSDIYQVLDVLGNDLSKKETKQLKKAIEVSSEIENNISIINRRAYFFRKTHLQGLVQDSGRHFCQCRCQRSRKYLKESIRQCF